MLLFSTPGMLHSGASLEVFKKWCGDPKNMVIIPGFCVPGTVGAKLLAGQRDIQMGDRTYPVRMRVQNLSFSAHADAKGILQLIRNCRPRHVVLVHGEAAKMEVLKGHVESEFGIPCHMPANGEQIELNTADPVPMIMDGDYLAHCLSQYELANDLVMDEVLLSDLEKQQLLLKSLTMRLQEGIRMPAMCCHQHQPPRLISPYHDNSCYLECEISTNVDLLDNLRPTLIKLLHPIAPVVKQDDNSLIIQSVTLTLSTNGVLHMKWLEADQHLANLINDHFLII